MPYKTEWVAPEVFLEYAGVTVYHTYKHDDIEQGPRGDRFVTNEGDGEDSQTESLFFVDELDNYVDPPPGDEWPHVKHYEQMVREAIDLGEIPMKRR